MIALDLEGIAVSAGAACSSGKVTASHVLAAMGLGRSPARRSGSRCRGTRQRRTSPPSRRPIGAWRRGCAWRWHRAPPEPTLPGMSSSSAAPEPPGLSRQPGHHALRPARRGGDAAVVHRALRQSAQRRARDGHRGRSRGRGRARPCRRADRRRCQGARVHLRRDREQQHRHQGRGPFRAARRQRATARRHGGDRAQMRPGIGGGSGGRGVRAGFPAGAPGRAAGSRTCCARRWPCRRCWSASWR